MEHVLASFSARRIELAVCPLSFQKIEEALTHRIITAVFGAVYRRGKLALVQFWWWRILSRTDDAGLK